MMEKEKIKIDVLLLKREEQMRYFKCAAWYWYWQMRDSTMVHTRRRCELLSRLYSNMYKCARDMI